jgi:hypothetical protein
MMVAAVALLAVSAYGSIKAGQDKKDYYNKMAEVGKVEADRKAVQYEFQGNQILQRTNAANASAIAKAFSGGVSGFDGSAQLVQEVTNQRGGKEFTFALANADSARRNGLIQASLYEDAGTTAEQTGYFDAAGKLGMAAASASSIGGAPSGGERAGGAAPVYDRSTRG